MDCRARAEEIRCVCTIWFRQMLLIGTETLLKVVSTASITQVSEAEQRRQHLGGWQTCSLDRAAD